MLAKIKFQSEKYFGPQKIFGQKNLFCPKNKKVKSTPRPTVYSFDNIKHSGWGQLSPGQMLHAQMAL